MNTTQIPLRVARKWAEADNVSGFELVADDGAELPGFTAGAHIDVEAAPGLIRQYSLCNAPAERHRYVIAVLREVASRGGSASMAEKLHEGDVLHVSAPRNHFPLAAEAPHHLLFAGGIGITPILAMAETLSALGTPFALHYACRSRASAAFLDRITASPFAEQAQCHFDDEAGGPLDLAAALAEAPEGAHVYVCGPAGFIDAVLGAAQAAGFPEAALHREFFAATAHEATAADGAFTVEIASTGQRIAVAADQPVIDALAAQGIDLPVSCEQGVCGTCVTRVLEGIPDHRDMFMTAAEHASNDQFTPCCSRAKTPLLVLDL
ncbi:PDR/VanB family oxidoreductase [Novosphingobium sp. 9]|uniref:PDR/VanB family oxidoreductase n=1 Tax=Novosphingobium sp. 9 TaxID=2025349 RepID=UPI0021B538DF|nr:PDR/VanB family oxidoreductase [Novosphingobium sp. 9]